MPALLFESSSSKACLILAHQGSVVEFFPLEGGSGLSRSYFALLRRLLENGSFSWETLDYLACGTGPGAFTGVRIAASIAQTLAYARNIPLVPFCSLVSFTPEKKGPFFSLLDAKSFGVYLLAGETQEKDTFFSYPAQAVKWEELESRLSRNSLLSSPDAADIQKRAMEKNIFLSCEETSVNAPFLAQLCEKKFLAKEYPSHPILELSYLRSP